MALNINSITQDFNYQKALKVLRGLTDSNGKPIVINEQMLSQSTVRSEIALSTTQTQYQVGITTNQLTNGQQLFPTEIRVNLQDVMAVSEIGIFVAVPASATDGAFQLFSFPTTLLFSTSQAAAIYGLYSNGYLQYKNNNQVVVPQWDLLKHLSVPQQQYAANAYFTASGTIFRDEFTGDGEGFYPVQPGWLLSGSSNNQMTINLAAAPAALPSNCRLVVMFRGILLQNLSGIR